MKKSAILVPIVITAVFATALIGLFIFRRLNPSYIPLNRETVHIENTPILDGKVNINTASAEDLVLLPGIGEGLAECIINHRNENGEFSRIEDLKNVSGIGDARFNAICDYITVG